MKAGGGHEGGTGGGGGCVGRGGGGGGGDGDDGGKGGGGGGEGGKGGGGGGESGGNGGEPSGKGGNSLELLEASSIILSVSCCCKSISRLSFVNGGRSSFKCPETSSISSSPSTSSKMQ